MNIYLINSPLDNISSLKNYSFPPLYLTSLSESLSNKLLYNHLDEFILDDNENIIDKCYYLVNLESNKLLNDTKKKSKLFKKNKKYTKKNKN